MVQQSAQVVVDCYSLMDRFLAANGFWDMTEGIYDGDANRSFEEAQRRQIAYLLDEARCTAGSRILELGCGNGTLLDAVRRRGAHGVGITISPEQVARCRSRGLEVKLINYRDLGAGWTGKFDAIVANGSAEHFVQPGDALEGRADALYRELFDICRRVLDPASPSRRLVTTIIHFARPCAPEAMAASPWLQRWGSDAFHFSMLAHSFGGYYPAGDQLARCAAGRFQLEKEIDGTDDYRLTSEHWLRAMQHRLLGRSGLATWRNAFPYLMRHPKPAALLLGATLVTQSWNWQFRTDHPPTRLLRQTWVACD